MRTDTKAKLNRLVLRERAKLILALLVCASIFFGFASFWLEPWDIGEVQTAVVISYHSLEGRRPRLTHGGGSKAIVRLSDGSEGVVTSAQPRLLLIGQEILVREKISRILGRRKFVFVGWPN